MNKHKLDNEFMSPMPPPPKRPHDMSCPEQKKKFVDAFDRWFESLEKTIKALNALSKELKLSRKLDCAGLPPARHKTGTIYTKPGKNMYDLKAGSSATGFDTGSFFIDGLRIDAEYYGDHVTRFAIPGRPHTAVIRSDRCIMLVPTPDDIYHVTFKYVEASDG